MEFCASSVLDDFVSEQSWILFFFFFKKRPEDKTEEAVNSNDGSNTSGHWFEVTLSDMEAFLMKEELNVPESYHIREKEFQNPK